MSANAIENTIQEIVEQSIRKGPIEALSVAIRHTLRLLASFEGPSFSLDLLLGTGFFCKASIDSLSSRYDKEAINSLGQIELYALSEYESANDSSPSEPTRSIASLVVFLSRFTQDCVSKPTNLINIPQEDLYNFYSVSTQFFRDEERLQLDFVLTAFEIRDLNLNSLQHRGLTELPNGGSNTLPGKAWFNDPSYKEEGSAYLRLLSGRVDLTWLRELGHRLISRVLNANSYTPAHTTQESAHVKKAEPRPRQKSTKSQTTQSSLPTADANVGDTTDPVTPNFRLPILKMLADTPIEDASQDLLGYKDYAEALALLIEHKETATPLTIAINAPWGAGKSSVAKMLATRLTKNRTKLSKEPYITCYFNAWQHDEAANVGAAFAAEIARTASGARDWWWRVLRPLPHQLRSLTEKFQFWIPTLLFCIAIGFLFFALQDSIIANQVIPWLTRLKILDEKAIKSITDALGSNAVTLFVTLLTAAGPTIFSLGKTLSGYIKSPEAAANAGTITQASKQLSALIAQATGNTKKFIIFVDDLERCRPPKSIEVLEAINQLISHPNVVTVILGDMPTVATSAAIKYKEVAEMFCEGEEKGPKAIALKTKFGRQYLQKIIQLQFDIPLPTKEKGQDLLTEFAKQESERQLTDSQQLTRDILTDKITFLKGVEKILVKTAKQRAETPTFFELGVRAIFAPVIEARKLHKSFKTLRQQVGDTGRNYPFLMIALVIGLIAVYLSALGYLVASIIFALPNGSVVTPLIGSLILAAIFVNVFTTRYFKSIQAANINYVGIRIEERLKSLDTNHIQEIHSLKESLLQQTQINAARDIGIAPRLPVDETGLIDALLEDQINTFLMSDSERLEGAMKTALEYLPPLPRSLKRLLNSMRMTLFMLARRQLFDDGKLTPQHVGKWAALRELYPELAQSLLMREVTFAEIEATSVKKEVADLLRAKYGLEIKHDAQLKQILNSLPKLTSVAEKIVFLEK